MARSSVGLVPRHKSLPDLAFAYGLPAPTSEVQMERVLDRWEAEVAAKLAVASALLALGTLPAAGIARLVFTPGLEAAGVVVLAIVAAAALFGLLSGLSAISLTLRARLGDPSLFVKLGVPLAMVVCFLLLGLSAAAFLLAGFSW